MLEMAKAFSDAIVPFSQMQGLSTSDYKGGQMWHGLREDDDSYPL